MQEKAEYESLCDYNDNDNYMVGIIYILIRHQVLIYFNF
jgi:hypothetical protein